MNKKPFFLGLFAILQYILATHMTGIYFTSFPWLSEPLNPPVMLYDILACTAISELIFALLWILNDIPHEQRGFSGNLLRWFFHLGFSLSILWLWRFITNTVYFHISSAVPTALLLLAITLYERRVYQKHYKK